MQVLPKLSIFPFLSIQKHTAVIAYTKISSRPPIPMDSSQFTGHGGCAGQIERARNKGYTAALRAHAPFPSGHSRGGQNWVSSRQNRTTKPCRASQGADRPDCQIARLPDCQIARLPVRQFAKSIRQKSHARKRVKNNGLASLGPVHFTLGKWGGLMGKSKRRRFDPRYNR